MDSGLQSLALFHIPSAKFWISKPKINILDYPSEKFPVALTIAVVPVSFVSWLAYAVVGEGGVLAESGFSALIFILMTFVYT